MPKSMFDVKLLVNINTQHANLSVWHRLKTIYSYSLFFCRMDDQSLAQTYAKVKHYNIKIVLRGVS